MTCTRRKRYEFDSEGEVDKIEWEKIMFGHVANAKRSGGVSHIED